MSNTPKSTNRPFETAKEEANGIPLARDEIKAFADEGLIAELKKTRTRLRLVVPLLLVVGFLATIGGALAGIFISGEKAKAKYRLLLKEKKGLETEYYDLLRTNRNNHNNCVTALKKQRKALKKANREAHDQVVYRNKTVQSHNVVVRKHGVLIGDFNDLVDQHNGSVANCRGVADNRAQLARIIQTCLQEPTTEEMGDCLVDKVGKYNRSINRSEQAEE